MPYTNGGYVRDLMNERFGDAEARARLLEHRAASSSTFAGITPPEYVAKDFAIGLAPAAAYTAMTNKLEDPGYGLQLNIPTLTAATTVIQQGSENAVVTQTAPSGQQQTSPIVTIVTGIEVSQQFIDRIDPAAEQLLHAQLSSALYGGVEKYVIAQAVATAQAQAGASTPITTAHFKGDLGQAFSAISTSAQLSPSTVWTSGPLGQFLLSWVDTSGVPLFAAAPSGQYKETQVGPTGQEPSGTTGSRVGMLDLMVSNGFTTGGLLVSDPEDVYSLVSDPQIDVIPQAGPATGSPTDDQALGAQTLTVLVRAYCYAGVVFRRATAHQWITGTAYPTSPTFQV